jgi:hypothetical protein
MQRQTGEEEKKARRVRAYTQAYRQCEREEEEEEDC